MDLQTLHANLSFGDLSNLSIGDSGAGTIPAAQHDKILLFVNQGLTAIYKRFSLLEKEVVIEAQDNVYLYYLQRKYAMTEVETIVPYKYLRDTATDPFLEDIIKILSVYNELGEKLPLNVPDDEDSLYTPKYDCLQIPEPVTGNAYTVLFQARHPVLVPNDLTQKIMLPSYLEEALQAYVAYRVLSPMNGEENTRRANDALLRYTMAVGEASDLDLPSTSQTTEGGKFDERGFV